jgi:membrane dipeptidase
MECADPIRTPAELGWWVERGVCAIGLAWARGSRFAGGNSNTGVGLTDLGRELLREMARLGVVHDLSHLSQKATDDVFEFDAELAAGDRARIIASHSNSREVMGDARERHVSDDTVREIARRGGIVGLNLCSAFLGSACWDSGRATIDDCVKHLEHMATAVGRRDFLALGSDMDGGFSAERLPRGVDLPRDLEKLAAGLGARQWSDAEVDGFAQGNWLRFWENL